MRISTKLTLLVAAVFLLVGLLGIAAIGRLQRVAETYGIAQASDIASTMSGLVTFMAADAEQHGAARQGVLSQHTREHLQELVEFIATERDHDVGVVDPNKRIVADEDEREIGTTLEGEAYRAADAVLRDGVPRTYVDKMYGKEMLQLVVPIRSLDDKIAGVLVFEYTRLHENLSEFVSQAVWAIAVLTVVGLLLALGAGLFFNRAISRPIGRLKEAATKIADGQSSVAVTVDSRDEIGDLAKAFNRMIQALRLSRVRTDTELSERRLAEEELRRVNQELLGAQNELVRKEKLALLGQIVGSVGHELRNPLGVMSNAVYFLQSTLPENADATTREYLGIIKDEITGAERIVSDLLDSVRTKPPKPVAVDLREAAAQTVTKIRMPENVSVIMELPSGLRALVDPLHLHQIVRNLVSNSIDAMANGGTLRISGAKRGDGTLTLQIADTGSGIAPEEMARLFQPLATTKARGIGLGLVIVKNLTEANEGNVDVTSTVGKGTTFTIVLRSAKATAKGAGA